jgi:hypothetical protein
MNLVRDVASSIMAFAATFSLGLVFLGASPAQAANPDCTATEAGTISGKQVDGYTYTSRGTRADVRVTDSVGIGCQHVSPIFLWNGNGGVEFGWLVGYSNCTGYKGVFYTKPKPFFWVRDSTGTLQWCKVWTGTNLPTQAYQSMRVSDVNADYVWGPWLNGQELLPGSQGVLLDFSQGSNGFGMERGDSGDNGYTRNNALSEYHDNGGWSPWDDVRPLSDNDLLYRFQEWAVDSAGTVVG